MEEDLVVSIVDTDSLPKRKRPQGELYEKILAAAYAAKPQSACVEAASIRMTANKLATALRQFTRRKGVAGCTIRALTKEGKVWITFA